MFHVKFLNSLPEAPRFLGKDYWTFFRYQFRDRYTQVDNQQLFFLPKTAFPCAIQKCDEVNMNRISWCTCTCKGFQWYVTEDLHESWEWFWLTSSSARLHRLYVGASSDLSRKFFFTISCRLWLHSMLIHCLACSVPVNYRIGAVVPTVSRSNLISREINIIFDIDLSSK